ncbi:hypothetical protein [Haladaptatus salinisoli]|uniref:hypothetical protein n=1 Tax=Haladaptatus salinisoli TaxID=2884876 RepID=UPI001D0A5AAE|nr:hypothetical protein [Haladaptatus salinisoli]
MAYGRYPSVDVGGDPQPTGTPFRLRVEKRRGFSPDAPARIRVAFENRSTTERTVGFGPIHPFSGIWSEGDGSLVLLPRGRALRTHVFGTDERIVPDRPVDGCWRTNLVRLVRPDVLRWRSLDAGERVRTEYSVLQYPEREIAEATNAARFGAEAETEGRLPAGEYRFEDSFLPRSGVSAFEERGTWREFTRGFTVTVGE